MKFSIKDFISKCDQIRSLLRGLRRVRKYLTVEKIKHLSYVFFTSQFSYAPLIEVFAGK